MRDFRGRVDTNRKHIPHAVGNDQLAVFALIMPRPIPEKSRTHAHVFAQHQLPAVRVAGQRQRQIRVNSGVKGVRMMRQENRESIRMTFFHQRPHLQRRDAVAIAAHAIHPAQAKYLDRIAAHSGQI